MPKHNFIQYPLKEEDMKTLADKMKQSRIDGNYTQEEYADLMGISVQQVRRLERGENQPMLIPIARLAKAIGVGIEYFTGHIESVEEQTERLWKEYEGTLSFSGKEETPNWKEKKRLLKQMNLWK